MGNARRGLAALFSKAAMPPTPPEDEEDVLEHDLDEDFVDYDEALAAEEEEDDDDEEDEDAVEGFDGEADVPTEDGGEAAVVSKAEGDLMPTDATPILQALLEKLTEQDTRFEQQDARLASIQAQQNDFAKAWEGFAGAYEEDMATLSKAVQVVRRKADEQPRPARSGQRRKHAPSAKRSPAEVKKPFAPEQKQAIFAKAAASPDLFGASDISKLESRLNLAAQTGDARYVTGGGQYGAPLSPEQLSALELV